MCQYPVTMSNMPGLLYTHTHVCACVTETDTVILMLSFCVLWVSMALQECAPPPWRPVFNEHPPLPDFLTRSSSSVDLQVLGTPIEVLPTKSGGASTKLVSAHWAHNAGEIPKTRDNSGPYIFTKRALRNPQIQGVWCTL